MNYSAIIAFLLILTLSGCQPVLRLITGVRKPKIENPESLKRFMQDNGFAKDFTYVLPKEEDFELITKEITFPNLLIFDEKGRQVKNNTFCVPDENYAIDLLLETGVRDTVRDFQYYLSFMSDPEGNPNEIHDDENIKAIIIWMIATGKKLGTKRVKVFESILNRSSHKIKIYYLNIDPQWFWYSHEKQG